MEEITGDPGIKAGFLILPKILESYLEVEGLSANVFDSILMLANHLLRLSLLTPGDVEPCNLFSLLARVLVKSPTCMQLRLREVAEIVVTVVRKSGPETKSLKAQLSANRGIVD